MKREFSAGGSVFKRNGSNIVWVARYPQVSKDWRGGAGWTLPKGWIAPEESAPEAALREVAEEVGVEARIVGKIPTVIIFFIDKQDNQKVMKFISYFLMEWAGDAPEKMDKETEKVIWGSFEEIYELLKYPGEKKILKQASKMLSKL